MNTKVKDMTTGSAFKLISTFALPLMIGNVFQQLYTVVDTAIVGKALGVNALAALGVTDWLYWLILGMIQGITQGFGILMASRFGAKQFEQLRQVVGGSVILAGLFSVVFLLFGLLIINPVLLLLNTPSEIIHWSALYLQIMFLGIPIVMAYNLLASILRSLGDSQTPLNAMIISSLINIGLDLLFVLVFHWGIAGAAIASVISQAFATLFCMLKVRKIDFLKLNRGHFGLNVSMARNLLSLGTPMAGQNAIIAIGGIIIQRIANGFGVVFLGGYTATNKLYGVLEIAGTSYGYAMTTYVGQNLGAQKYERIRTGMKIALIISVMTSILIATIMLLFGRSIVGMFISGTPEQILEAIRVGYVYLCYMSFCLPILYILHVVRSAVQGMGNTVLPMVSGIAELIMRTGGVLLLPSVMGQDGVFFAEVLAWFGAVLILVPSYFITYQKNCKT